MCFKGLPSALWLFPCWSVSNLVQEVTRLVCSKVRFASDCTLVVGSLDFVVALVLNMSQISYIFIPKCIDL